MIGTWTLSREDILVVCYGTVKTDETDLEHLDTNDRERVYHHKIYLQCSRIQNDAGLPEHPFIKVPPGV